MSDDLLSGEVYKSIVQSCASITDTALSSWTLQSSHHVADDTSIEQQIRREQAIATWMERQRAQLHLVTVKPSPSALHPTDQLHHTLLHETATVQQHEKIQQLLAHGQVVLESNNDVRLQQAVHCRDNQVLQGLHLSQQLRQIQQDIQKLQDECQQLREDAKTVWKQLQQSTSPTATAAAAATTSTMTAVEQENWVYQQLLPELIAISGLDWYQDERLRDIVLTCTGAAMYVSEETESG